MKDIFTDLYNKVLGFFRQTEKQEESAKEVACNRLKFVLMQDRTNLTPELMDRMRKELIELLSRYVEMDKEALELGFEQEGNQMALMLSIPVLRAREEAEIEATLAEEDAKKAEAENVSESDTEETENTEETQEESPEESVEIVEEADTNSSEDTDDEAAQDEEGKKLSSKKKAKTVKD